MTPEQVERLLTWVILGVILGGRLGYVLFYQPAYYLAEPVADPAGLGRRHVLPRRLRSGSSSRASGSAGASGIPMLSMADLLAVAAPVGLMLGRLANFINAELWGRPTDLPWGVIFPGEAAQACAGVVGLCARHPSQLYEAALEGLLLGAASCSGSPSGAAG